ncbi:1,25-dihydroxyvitamin D(3) 24-hydroxylase, mitochondrial-like [Pyxicephalus adspersus]|uniref:1,25-dihydroxyvitamin D(3) 24-hydroxylase, mitochondrial-like n=1 Tax=Pyxicephalus adspersus TaxID=30357 RepID=UPI003B5CDCF2
MLKYHQQFGGIFKMNLGFFKSVQIGDPALLEILLRMETPYPKRMEIKPWKMYREYRGEDYGLLTLDGKYNAHQMMEYLGPLLVTSADLHKQFNTKAWKNHTEAWDYIFSTAKCFIDRRLKSNPAWKNDLLNTITSNYPLTNKQLSGLFTELQIGGVETTANSLLWLLYNLSRHSEVQKKVLDEIQTVLLPGQPPSTDCLQKMPYLKACIKESMRLTPTVPFTSRTIENDTNLGGYLIPGGVIAMINFHSMAWNENYFPDAREYKPERWLKPRTLANSFASTPFGVGKRMCVGRRLAELQLQLTLCWIIQHFYICTTDNEPCKAITSGLMVPTRQLPVSFKKR